MPVIGDFGFASGWKCSVCGYGQPYGSPCNCEEPGTPAGAVRRRFDSVPASIKCGDVWGFNIVTRIDRGTNQIDMLHLRDVGRYFQEDKSCP